MASELYYRKVGSNDPSSLAVVGNMGQKAAKEIYEAGSELTKWTLSRFPWGHLGPTMIRRERERFERNEGNSNRSFWDTPHNEKAMWATTQLFCAYSAGVSALDSVFDYSSSPEKIVTAATIVASPYITSATSALIEKLRSSYINSRTSLIQAEE